MIEIINQIFSLETKLKKQPDINAYRNFERIYHEIALLGYQIENPLGKTYRNEMTDVDANITGQLNDSSKIIKVLKPTIYYMDNGYTKLVQKGIVIVE